MTNERSSRPRSPRFTLRGGAPRPLGRLLRARVPQLGDCVIDDAGGRHRLDRRIGGGGEGEVYSTDGGLVAKVYAPERQWLRTRQKLELMVATPLAHPAVCWPRSLARNAAGEWVGYLMPAGRGKALQRSIFVKPLFAATFPTWSRVELVTLARTVLDAIAHLHEENVLLGDINPNNILVENERSVAFVDTDSYQLEDFPCPVGTATFLAPELAGRDLGTLLRDSRSERFAVATLVFMMLVPGKPPYSHAGGGNPAENVQRRHFPYCFAEKRSVALPEGPWRFVWSHLPFYLKQAFHRAFAEGVRMMTSDWSELLERYAHDLERGHVSPEIFPMALKPLRRENVERRGGLWRACLDCGQEFGALHGSTLCPRCVAREIDVTCFLCSRRYTERARRTRAGVHEAICPSCRQLSTTTSCRTCGTAFELSARDRAFFKAKGLSLPKRCRACRDAAAGRGPQVTATPTLDTSPDAAKLLNFLPWFWTGSSGGGRHG